MLSTIKPYKNKLNLTRLMGNETSQHINVDVTVTKSIPVVEKVDNVFFLWKFVSILFP